MISVRSSSDILVLAGFPAEHDAHPDADVGENVKRAFLLLYPTSTGNHSRTLFEPLVLLTRRPVPSSLFAANLLNPLNPLNLLNPD